MTEIKKQQERTDEIPGRYAENGDDLKNIDELRGKVPAKCGQRQVKKIIPSGNYDQHDGNGKNDA
jgi:hypothetical protein